ncbi:MAG: hypothetical protein J6W84_07380, partial [Bacteroidales bacterium]|nr:hypothetical protein [Bacteroidales bacterium]
MKHFYNFLLAFLCLSAGLVANAQVISTLPWSDGFEGGLNNWIVESDDIDYEWILAEGNPAIFSILHSAHNGTQNVYFYSSNHTSSLLSPVFNLAGKNNVVISFWYSMQVRNGNNDELTLYYRKSSSDSWTELVYLSGDMKDWYYVQVPVTDLSSTVQFKFEGHSQYGGGVLIDDITVKENDYWTDEGNYNISWYDGSGNYSISNAAQLAGVAYLVNNGTEYFANSTINLTSDIDLTGHEWVPIGSFYSNYYFAGKFKGNNHTIDNLFIADQDFSDYSGLFGYINMDATIQDLTLEEHSSINATNKVAVGGFVGAVKNSGSLAATISNCINKATIVGYMEVGGIVGATAAQLNISNCYNYGDICALNHNTDFVGGIIGDIASNTNITSCGNYGTVYALGDVAGGIAGGGYRGVFDKCFNKGEITADGKFVGGICGNYGYIVNCYNLGVIRSNDSYAGGICGDKNSEEPIYNCFNRGKVSVYNKYAGGIVGYAEDNVSVVNVYNTAMIFASEYKGAIIGYLSTSESNCTLLGYYDNDYASDNLNSFTSMSGSSMKTDGFASTLNSHLSMNPNSDLPWETWQQDNLSNGGYPTFGFDADYGHYWICSGNYNTDWFQPFTTTFNIGTAVELAGVAYLCDIEGETFEGKTIKLTADIDLAGHEWVAIGNQWDPIRFGGSFDGNNHKISNLYSEAQDFSYLYGLIGNMYNTNTSAATFVKDLTIDATCEIYVPDYDEIGGIVAFVGSNDFTISNCKNYATVTGSYYVGGIIGDMNSYSSSENSQFYISQCENYGKISGQFDVAGIVGYSYADNITIDNCTNNGDILSANSDGYVGGIAGYADVNDTCIITNCQNNGNIWGDDYYMGGIIGYADGHNIIDNCTNTGEVKNYDGIANYDDYVGGIAGYIYGYQSVVSNCTNIGDIIGDDEVGGIVGYTNTGGTAFENYPSIHVFVTDCQNRGNVTAPYGYETGGIVGEASNSSAWIDRCSNSGNITGYDYVGGISGYRGSVSNCYNTGNIVSDDYYAGGIIGYMCGNSPDYALLANCYNRGNVSANDYDAGGLVGYASDYSYITNCYTTGEVTADSDFGAVIGNKYDSDVIMNALFYNDNLDNDNGFGTAMSAADMKSAVLLDTLNGYVSVWNPDNINFIQLEAWEFRNG